MNGRLSEKHLSELHRAQIRVDATWHDDPALSTWTKKVKALLKEQLEQVHVLAVALSVDNRDLVLILRSEAEEIALVIKATLIGEPCLHDVRVAKQPFEFLLELLDVHFLLRYEVAVISKEFFLTWVKLSPA